MLATWQSAHFVHDLNYWETLLFSNDEIAAAHEVLLIYRFIRAPRNDVSEKLLLPNQEIATVHEVLLIYRFIRAPHNDVSERLLLPNQEIAMALKLFLFLKSIPSPAMTYIRLLLFQLMRLIQSFQNCRPFFPINFKAEIFFQQLTVRVKRFSIADHFSKGRDNFFFAAGINKYS